MIKFFRKIRQKMLTENKFSKYLLYAVGEIILVVIGILIALQINNWNEKEKLKAEEVKFLKNFKQSLISDIDFNNFRFDKY
jgi:sensor domain CHASE-containing protein